MNDYAQQIGNFRLQAQYNSLFGGLLGGATTGNTGTYNSQILFSQPGGIIITEYDYRMPAPAKAGPNLAWLDERVNEMRVKL